MRARSSFVLLWASLASYGGGSNVPPTRSGGESQHFRLWLDLDLGLDPSLTGSDELARLETDWSDNATFLRTPEEKVDYYWLTADHAQAVCHGFPSCFGGGSVYTYVPVHGHELIHAYTYPRRGHFPLPLVAEGVAEAVGCAASGNPAIAQSVPWRDVAAQTNGDGVYQQGKQLVRYLIVTHGVDAFLQYYDQAPSDPDPDAFAANFSNFWGRSIDDV